MSATGGLPSLVSWQHGYGQFPQVGPKALAQTYPWTSQGTYIIDLTTEALMDVIRGVQGVWFDNSKNTNSATLTMLGYAGQVITVPASKIWLIPLFVAEAGLVATLTSTVAASQLTNLIFLNVPVPIGSVG